MAALTMPETMPLSDAANATMQTNSGAGLGTVTQVLSTAMAISAVAAARLGPHSARQSICMVGTRETKVSGASMRIVALCTGFSQASVNAGLPGWTRFSDPCTQI